MVNWFTALSKIILSAGIKTTKVDSKYIVVKPRILSDDNYLRGVSILRGVVALVPPAAIASPVMGLGAIGFKIWKRIALSAEYDQLQYPPIDPNMLRLSIATDSELNKHYGHLVLTENWAADNIENLEHVYNDLQFITDFEMLSVKYPYISPKYIKNKCEENKDLLKTNLDSIEQELLKVSTSPAIEHNIREAFSLLAELFPAMNNWALFNSRGFNEVIDLLDTII